MFQQRKKIESRRDVVTLLTALLFCAGIVIFFIIGGVFFSKENPRVKYYQNTLCQVDSRSYQPYTCKNRYSSYICYGPVWLAHFSLNNQIINTVVEQDKRYDSYRDAIKRANQYEINGNYSCWYDTRDPTVAQWDKPSALVAIILLCCGGLSVLLSILFFFLTNRFIKEKRMQMQVQPSHIHPPTYDSIFSKH